AWVSRRIDGVRDGYVSIVTRLIRVSAFSLVAVAVAIAGFVGLSRVLPGGFLPEEDQGALFMEVKLPSNASLNRTERVMEDVRLLVQDIPGLQIVNTVAGFSLLDSLQVGNAGFMVLLLSPFDERTDQGITAFDVLAEAQRRVATIPEAQVMVFNVPPIPGLGTTAGFDFRLESLSGGSPAELGSVAGGLVFAANGDPRLSSVFTTFSVDTPRLIVDLDREKAQTLGVS